MRTSTSPEDPAPDTDPVEIVQRMIAERMGVPWGRYAANCENGVKIAGDRSRWWERSRFSLRVNWSGLPKLHTGKLPISVLRFDRSKYPYFEPIPEEDSVGVVGFNLVPEGEAVSYKRPALEAHADVVRLSVRFWRWRAVLALFSWVRVGKCPRFGLDVVAQARGGHWRQCTLRLYGATAE